MSEPSGDSAAGGGDSGDSSVSPPPPARPGAPAYRGVAITLAALLLLVAALAGTAPFWAPSLPWAPPPRLAAPPDPRIDRLEAALQQSRQDAAAAKAARQELERRVAALAAKPAAPAGDIADLRQQVAALTTAAADLAAQVAALGKTVQAQQQAGAELAGRAEAAQRERAGASSDTAIALVLLQIRGALAAGRPFAAEYDALTALARDRPEIIAAAAPLAAPAKTGVAGRAVVAERLRRLAPAIAKTAATETPGAASGWRGRMLDRLRGLVRVRRIDGTGQPAAGGGEAPVDAGGRVDAAERALAGGDLAGAIAAIDKLGGAAADATRPWLDMARQRVAVETALQQIEAALTARLGAAAKPPTAAGTSP